MSITLPNVIGMPPKTGHELTDGKILDSMPRLKLVPMESQINKGIHFMTLRNAMSEYRDILGYHGFNVPSGYNHLDICFLNEGSINDSVSSDYGDSFLAKFANVASSGFMEARQIVGGSTLNQMQANLNNMVKDISGALGGKAGAQIGGMVSGAMNTVVDAGQAGLRKLLGGNAKAAENLLIGNRLDLPQIWKGSSSTFDYGVTIRLYNPNPSDETSYQKYIIGPIAALLLFCMPRSNDGQTYRWPFLCRASCPGIFKINCGAIKDISVTKGGDSGSFTYFQTPTIVDVKITISELYTVRVALEKGAGNMANVEIPTLKDYIEGMKDRKRTSNQPHYVPLSITSSISNDIRTFRKLESSAVNTVKSFKNKESKNKTKHKKDIKKPDEIMTNNWKNLKDKSVEKYNKYKKKLNDKTKNISDDIEERVENDDEQTQSTLTGYDNKIDNNNNIVALGKNSYVDKNKKIAVLDENDFKNDGTMEKVRNKLVGYGYTVNELKQNKLPDKNSTVDEIVDENVTFSLNNLNTTVHNDVESIGFHTVIDHKTKIANIDSSDFPTTYAAIKLKKKLESLGYNVNFTRTII